MCLRISETWPHPQECIAFIDPGLDEAFFLLVLILKLFQAQQGYVQLPCRLRHVVSRTCQRPHCQLQQALADILKLTQLVSGVMTQS